MDGSEQASVTFVELLRVLGPAKSDGEITIIITGLPGDSAKARGREIRWRCGCCAYQLDPESAEKYKTVSRVVYDCCSAHADRS